MSELAKLEFLSGQLETMDQFTDTYQTMLDECKAIADPVQRKDRAAQLKKILLRQSQFLMNLWIQEYRDIKPDGVIVQ
ncbi:MAG: hypothetical protein H8D67_05750 [Deltaproteobacteria bacterium]|nr:hypothetical protein [Deltaproteobacteria bacterium]